MMKRFTCQRQWWNTLKNYINMPEDSKNRAVYRALKLEQNKMRNFQPAPSYKAISSESVQHIWIKISCFLCNMSTICLCLLFVFLKSLKYLKFLCSDYSRHWQQTNQKYWLEETSRGLLTQLKAWKHGQLGPCLARFGKLHGSHSISGQPALKLH